VITEARPQSVLSQRWFSSYDLRMTKLLEQAIEAVRRLPADSQDDIARTILHLAGSELEAEPIDPAHFWRRCSKGSRKQSAANLPRMTKSRLPSTALIGEAAVHTARDALPCGDCRVSAYP
jgi:hypothetical protein